MSNLEQVWADFYRRTRVRSACGVDGVTPEVFREGKHWRLREIHHELGAGYTFSALRGLALPKKDPSKLRLICVPTIADRLVQRALLAVIEGQSARLGILNQASFGFVRDRGGTKRGVHGARQLAVKLRHKAPWAFKADISKFFDTIDRSSLSQDFSRSFHLRTLSPLVRKVIDCEVLVGDDRVKLAVTQNDIKVGRGLRQGMPLSPILSNFVLREFDKNVGRQFSMVRYADDLLVFAPDEALCKDAEKLVESELAKLGLRLSVEKSYICRPDEAVEFLGMELRRKTDQTYHLIVSEPQMKSIRNSFRVHHDLSYLHSKRLDAASLFRLLQQMRSGYLSAYGCADNFETLKRRLDQWTQACAQKVYSSIFGDQAVARLNAIQKKFLMLS